MKVGDRVELDGQQGVVRKITPAGNVTVYFGTIDRRPFTRTVPARKLRRGVKVVTDETRLARDLRPGRGGPSPGRRSRGGRGGTDPGRLDPAGEQASPRPPTTKPTTERDYE